MRKTIFLLMILLPFCGSNVNVNAQPVVKELWKYSSTTNPSYNSPNPLTTTSTNSSLTTYNCRSYGIAISKDGKSLYLPTAAPSGSGPQVAIFDPKTGLKKSTNMTAMPVPGSTAGSGTGLKAPSSTQWPDWWGATYLGGDIAVDGSGAIYLSEMTGYYPTLKVAKWSSESATPAMFLYSNMTSIYDTTNGGHKYRPGLGIDVYVDGSGNGFLLAYLGYDTFKATTPILYWEIQNNAIKGVNGNTTALYLL